MKILLRLLLITIFICNTNIISQEKKLGFLDLPKPISPIDFKNVSKELYQEGMNGIYIISNIRDLKFGPRKFILNSKAVQDGYIVLINKKSTNIEISSNTYEGINIDFSIYGLQFDKSNYWIIKISGEIKNTLSLVSILINKQDYELFIDGIKKEKNKTYFLLSKGYHVLAFMYKNKIAIIDTVNITDTKNNFTYNFSNINSEKIIIRTVPSGATVYINDIEEGKTDLITFKNPGKYKIKLILPEHYTIEDYIEIKSGGNNVFNYIFNKSLASLKISTEPSNVKIYLNGKLIKENQIELEAVGNYILEIERSNVKRILDNIIVKIGDRISKSYNLLLPTGNLLLTVSPDDAILKIDGVKFEKKDTIKLEEGFHNIEIEKEGYNSYKELIYITKNDIKRKFVNLIPNYGNLIIKVTPPDFKIRLRRDNKVVKEVLNKTFIDSLIEGKYLIEISSEPKYYSYKDTIVISKNITKSINVKLKLKDIYDVKIVNVLYERNFIKNVRFQKEDYYYDIIYDLEGDKNTEYEIKLYLVDKSQSYERIVPLKYVVGDINKVKGYSKNKTIKWIFINEYPQGIDNNNLYLLLKGVEIKSGIPWYIYPVVVGGAAAYFIIKGKTQSNESQNQLPLPPKRPSGN